MSIVGHPYIDIFLAAGLSCHKVHHVLPGQKSGFANIVSEPYVREVAKEYGVEWSHPKNFLLDRLPKLFFF